MSERAAVQASGPVCAPSRLGTEQHCDKASRAEGATFDEIGGEGDIWFGESPGRRNGGMDFGESPDVGLIADVESGKGDLTSRLFDAGYTSITGIDYSEASIDLARARAISRRRDVPLDAATFAIRDVLSAEVVATKVIDALYPERIAGMVQPGGIFFITRCINNHSHIPNSK
ncbi:hypothetical protein RQP46_009813 [Phenoliferia psychrophenolica]